MLISFVAFRAILIKERLEESNAKKQRKKNLACFSKLNISIAIVLGNKGQRAQLFEKCLFKCFLMKNKMHIR